MTPQSRAPRPLRLHNVASVGKGVGDREWVPGTSTYPPFQRKKPWPLFLGPNLRMANEPNESQKYGRGGFLYVCQRDPIMPKLRWDTAMSVSCKVARDKTRANLEKKKKEEKNARMDSLPPTRMVCPRFVPPTASWF